MSSSLVVQVASGQNDPERCAQAFTIAATAVASGVPTSLWLAGEASWFALPGRAETFELAHSAPLSVLLASLLSGGTLASVTLCSQCALRRGISNDDVISGIRIAGAALFVEEIMADNVQVITY